MNILISILLDIILYLVVYQIEFNISYNHAVQLMIEVNGVKNNLAYELILPPENRMSIRVACRNVTHMDIGKVCHIFKFHL